MDDSCKCCQGIEPLTPMAIANRPGLPALRYRAGTQATFLETMLARLSSSDYPALAGPSTPLGAGLTTRERNDPAIALLDAWATVADVLTFYQERFANEGYLRTAAERRSILELARLVGYALRPGVAASVYLAYTVDENAKEEVIIPQGARVQSLPGPGELPQTFETSEDLAARAEWNNLQPRLSRPQKIILDEAPQIAKLYLAGTATNLKLNDALLLVFGDQPGQQVLRRVEKITPLSSEGKTEVLLQEVPYLVIALVPLLRMAILGLEKRLGTPDNIGTFARWLRDVLLAALENLLLGNYPPPLEQFFSHDHIYSDRIDSLLRWESLVVDWLGFLPKDILELAAARMHCLGLTLTALMADEDLKVLWGNLVDGVVQLLRNTWVRQHLICSLRTIVEAARPKSYEDQQAILNIITKESVWMSIHRLFVSVPHMTQPSPASIANMLFRPTAQARPEQGGLRDELISLLTDRHIKATLKLLLSDLSVIIAGSDLPTETKNSLQNRMEQASAAIEGLPTGPDVQCGAAAGPTTSLAQLVKLLRTPPSLQPANQLRLTRRVQDVYANRADINLQILMRAQPRLSLNLYPALAGANLETESPQLQGVYALRLTAPPFGYNAPAKLKITTTTENKAKVSRTEPDDEDWKLEKDEEPFQLFLDNAYDAVLPGGYAVIHKSSDACLATRLKSAQTLQRAAYTMSGKTTCLVMTRKWWNPDDMATLRRTVVYAQSERLDLADEPMTDDIASDSIELGRLYDGLQPGRWVIVHGEVTHISGTSGVKDGELAMIARVEQSYDKIRPGDKLHTTIYFANGLSYTYKRSTVKVYANVVKATHGETRAEVLGSGDGSKALQSFALKQPPLTYVAAPVPSGVESTLQVRVNDILWHETDTLTGLSSGDHKFITKTDDEGQTAVTFGNGQEGARLPTGVENVRAVYRSGIGKAGNVRAGQLSLLMTRPLGVKEVVNPLAASGGADRESRDLARVNAPLAVKALDRLVSAQDYADFARTYAGIGKASAAQLSDGRRQLVYLTIAGVDDIPIEEHSDLYRNLVQALRRYDDPYQPFQVKTRELLLLVIEAGVRLLPDYLWESVEPKIRSALLDAFSFERRELGQDVFYSEVVSAIQAVPGVAYVDLDALDAASHDDVLAFLAQTEQPDLIAFLKSERKKRSEVLEEQPRKHISVHLARPDADPSKGIAPAQLAFLSPEVPDTLILKEKPL